MLIDIALSLYCGIADRVRGGFPDDKLFADATTRKFKNINREIVKFTHGAALAAGVGVTDIAQLVVAGVMWKFGEQIAGNFGETFKHLSFPNYSVMPIVRVSLLWPLVTVGIMTFWDGLHWLFLLPASLAGFTAAAISASVIGDTPSFPRWFFDLRTAPAWQEFLRGMLTAFLFTCWF